MALRNNGGGNPYHDEKGRFTSGSGSSSKGTSQEKQNMYGTKHSPNILSSYYKYMKHYMPPERMNDDQLIDKSLNNLVDYAKKIGISNPTPNSEWVEDLYYQLGNDGVPEEKIRGLVDRFESRMKEKEDDQLIDKALNDLIDRAKRWGAKNPVPNEDWYEDLYNQLKDNGVPEDKIRRLADKFYERMIKEKDVKDNELIDKSLNNLIDYAKRIGISNPVPNSDWYDDLYYQLGNDGVPEEKIKGLMDKFKSRMNNKKIQDMGFSPYNKK